MKKPTKTLNPVIKWSGSKRKVAIELSDKFLSQGRYFEPFVGGGSMLPFRGVDKGIASDIIPELIELWNEIKKNPDITANEYKVRWDKLQNDGHGVYYEIRDNFNKTKNPFDFLFLTRTCVNGLIRYNSNGEFNNSIHKNRPGINPERLKGILKEWSYLIKGVEFFKQDYRETLSSATKKDFVFLDPPYGGTKGRYTKNDFNVPDFYNELEILNSKGVSWMLTFDGNAGEREYDFQLPKEIYKNKFFVQTGNSPFTKLMKTSIDKVNEAVYTNYNFDKLNTNKIGKQYILESI
jgi:DNA adenine methylase